jgi:hypothetical protein
MLTVVCYALTALIAAGIIILGARALLVPRAAAAGFGLPAASGAEIGPYLAIKGVRDIGSGLIALALLIAAPAHALAWFLVAAACIPLGDMLIVVRSRGSRTTAYAIHGTTAAVMLAAGTALLLPH